MLLNIKSLLVCIIITSFTFVSYADKVERAVINYKGTEGYFFSLDIGKRVLIDLKELQISREKISLLKEELKLKDEIIKLKQLNIEVTEKISDKWKLSFEAEHDLRIKEREVYENRLKEKNAWYKTPTFIYIAGILTGGLLAVGLAFGVNWATDGSI